MNSLYHVCFGKIGALQNSTLAIASDVDPLHRLQSVKTISLKLLAFSLVFVLAVIIHSHSYAQTVIQIGTGTGAPNVGTNPGTSENACSPYGGNVSFGACGKKNQLIYTKEMIETAMSNAGLTPGICDISTVGFNITALLNSTVNLANYTVKMANVVQADLSPGYYNGAFTTVYGPQGTVFPSTGWFSLTMAAPFQWDGVSNLCVEVCYTFSMPFLVNSYGGCQYTVIGGNNRMGFAGGASASCATVLPGTGSQSSRLCNMRLTVTPAAACEGTPPVTTAESALVCDGTSTNLELTGLPAESGYSFLWKYSATSGGPYTPASGINTNETYDTPSTLPSNPAYYICEVTCDNSGEMTQSTEGVVTLNTLLNCYCSTNFTSAAATIARGLTNVNLAGNTVTIDQNSAANTALPSPYSLYETPVADLTAGGAAYELKTTVGTATNNLHYVAAWIDYDQDGYFGGYTAAGVFDAVGDYGVGGLILERIATVGPTANVQTTSNFSVPSTATPGLTAMRVRYRYGATLAGVGACQLITGAATDGGAGEVEDYRVFIEEGCVVPTQQATGSVTNNLGTTSTDLNWVNGNGTGGRIVLIHENAPVDAIPVSGTIYTASNVFGNGSQLGSGNFVVYSGNGSSVSVTGLLPSTTYYYAIFEYNETSTCYMSTANTGSFTTLSCAPTIQPVLESSCADFESINLTFSGGNGTNTLIVFRAGSPVDEAPQYNVEYTANTIFGSGSLIGSGNFVVYNGAASGSETIQITGLTPGVTYYFSLFEYNAAPNCYNINAPATGTLATRSPGYYASSTVTQVTATLEAGMLNQQVVALNIVNTGGTDDPAILNSLTFTTSGTTNVNDISNARIFYTGTSSTFAAATQFGSAIATPNGTHVVTGFLALEPGTNYLWVVYDISASASAGNQVDASVTTFNLTDFNGTNNHTPSVTAPAGSRQITSLSYCAAQPGTSSSRASCFQGEQITNLNIGSGNFISGYTCNSSNGYDNLTATNSVSVDPGASYTFSLTADIWFSVEYRWVVWVDWDQNGDFTGPNERYPATGNIINYSSSSQPFVVPAGAIPGSTRMRVWHQEFSHAPPAGAPCRTSNGPLSTSIGQVVDLTVNVSGTVNGNTPCNVIAPVVTTPVSYNLGNVASPLTATGSGLLWYTSPTGGVGSTTPPTPSTSVFGYTEYYVSQSLGCEGPRTQIAVDVNGACGYLITSGAFGSGTISPLGNTTVAPGGSQTYIITPDCGYTVSTLLVDGIPSGTPLSYTFTNVNEPHSISVTFVQITEICNGVDDDCDGLVDETCSPPPNDNPLNAILIPLSGNSYPNCSVMTGTLAYGTVAPQNTAFAGTEVWYRFFAVTNGVSITMAGLGQDNAIALYNSSFVLMPGNSTENAVGQGGTETLNYDQLIPGAEYFIAAGTVTGPGVNFSICLKHLRDSFCADGSGTYQLCSNLKAQFTGATNYTYNFTPTGSTGGSPSSITHSGQLPLSTVALGLRYGGTYTVRIDANYNNLTFGNNQPDTPITILGVSICNITIAPHAVLYTKLTQQCPATLLRASILNAKPFVCAATSFTVEFTKVSDCTGTNVIGFPFEINTVGASSNLNLSFTGPNQLTNQSYYRVRWRPNFSYGQGTYGETNYIFIGGAVMENTEELLSEVVGSAKVETSLIEANLYPNPNNGEMVNLNMTDLSSTDVFVRVMDGMGRVVYSNRYTVDGSFNTLVTFTGPLSSGLYMVEFTSGDQIITERMIVER